MTAPTEKLHGTWIAGAVVAAGLWMGGRAPAQEPIITSFQDGYVSWTNVDPSLYYTVESKPNLTGSNEWDGAHRISQDIQSAEDTITVPVGVFYRVVGSTNPMHALPSAIDSTARDAASNAQATADAALPKTWTNTAEVGSHADLLTQADAAATYQPAGDYATGMPLYVESQTLADAAAKGGFAGTETIEPYRVLSYRYGLGAGEGSVGNYNFYAGWATAPYTTGGYSTAVGPFAAYGARGRFYGSTAIGDHAAENSFSTTNGRFLAVGNHAYEGATGEYNVAVGSYSFSGSEGSGNLSLGLNTMRSSTVTNSIGMGPWVGQFAIGSNQIYIDSYGMGIVSSIVARINGNMTDTYEPTNCVIFSDDGALAIGRGGSDPYAAPRVNVLRGEWAFGGEVRTNWPLAGIDATARSNAETAYATATVAQGLASNSATALLAHAADTVPHVSDGDRANWDGKATLEDVEGVGYLLSETGTLAQAAARGGFAGTESIAPLAVNARRFGNEAGRGASDTFDFYAGDFAGRYSTGDHNTAIGMMALESPTGTFHAMTAVGTYAGANSTAGGFPTNHSSTFVGAHAGDHSSGSDMTGLGEYALYAASGYQSSAVGYHAAQFSSSTGSTSVGFISGERSVGSYYSAIGSSSGKQSTGDYWSALGGGAGELVAGNSWLAVGRGSGYSSIGDDWSAFGRFAGMYSVSTGATMIGYSAGKESLGNYFSALGVSAGTQSTGDYWSALGSGSGQLAKGTNWLAVGRGSGYSSIGDDWSAFGRFAGMYSVSTGATMIGYSAGKESLGNYFSALGVSAGTQSTGDYWSALGSGSGQLAKGTNWLAVGRGSGYSSIGDDWSAFSRYSGMFAIWTNSVSLGYRSAWGARGVNRMYLDNLATNEIPDVLDPLYSATNNAIFLDDGALSLGRGGSYSNMPPRTNNLRGTWLLNGAPVGTGGGISTAAELTCAPTVTVTKADIQAAPGGELRLTLTCTVEKLTFLMSTFEAYDAGTWTIAITAGTNALAPDANTIQGWDGIAWTNSDAVPNDIRFRKVPGITNAVKVLGTW